MWTDHWQGKTMNAVSIDDLISRNGKDLDKTKYVFILDLYYSIYMWEQEESWYIKTRQKIICELGFRFIIIDEFFIFRSVWLLRSCEIHDKVIWIPQKRLCHKYEISGNPGLYPSSVIVTTKKTPGRNSIPVENHQVREDLEELKLKSLMWILHILE